MEQWIRHRRTIRLIVYTLIGIVFILLILHDLNPSGVLKVAYDLCKPSPYVSALSPDGRVLAVEEARGHCEQRMVIDPVYLDLRLPQRYSFMTMSIVFKKKETTPLRLGVQTSLTEWAWDLKEPEVRERMLWMTPQYPGWQTASADFDLRAVPLAHRRLRLMLSSPQLHEKGEEVVIREVRFVLQKPREGREVFTQWLQSFAVP